MTPAALLLASPLAPSTSAAAFSRDEWAPTFPSPTIRVTGCAWCNEGEAFDIYPRGQHEPHHWWCARPSLAPRARGAAC